MFWQYRLSMIGPTSTIFMEQHNVTLCEYFMNLQFNPHFRFDCFQYLCLTNVKLESICVWLLWQTGAGKVSLHRTMSFFSNSNKRILKHIKHTTNNKHTQYSVNRNQFNFLKFIKLLNNLIFVKTWPESNLRLPLFQHDIVGLYSFNQCQSPDENPMFHWN